MLMLKELLHLDFGMFRQPSEHKQGLLWFNSKSFDYPWKLGTLNILGFW